MLALLITTKQISMLCLGFLATQAIALKYQGFPWLVQHMPVASFFTWINKFYETKETERLADTYHHMRYYMSNQTGLYIYPFRELEDTLSMVSTILKDKGELAPPKRWRITEFHDYAQAEAWKIDNVNQGLPQDLFPAPVKVQYNEQTLDIHPAY
jgi:hypothetical protein